MAWGERGAAPLPRRAAEVGLVAGGAGVAADGLGLGGGLVAIGPTPRAIILHQTAILMCLNEAPSLPKICTRFLFKWLFK
jgi:hypothetical protein